MLPHSFGTRNIQINRHIPLRSLPPSTTTQRASEGTPQKSKRTADKERYGTVLHAILVLAEVLSSSVYLCARCWQCARVHAWITQGDQDKETNEEGPVGEVGPWKC